MKILYGITKSNFGGAQQYVLEMALEAHKRGNDVAVICGKGKTLIEKLEKNGIKVFPLESLDRNMSVLDDLRSLLAMLEVIGNFKPDIFHINSSKMGGLGATAGRIMKVNKIIFTAHGWPFNEPRPVLQKTIIKFFLWLTVLLSHKTICVSQKTKDDISNLPFIKNKLVVIHNGINKFKLMPKAQARERFAMGIPDDVLIVGAISELHKIKGLDVLLSAWHKFSKRYNSRLVIIGEGEEREDLEAQAEALGIKDSVMFKGYMENARVLLSGFDIFTMPSISEALPYALLEAGFAGLPVIATEVGGIPEIVESGESGILIPPEDPESLFSSLILLGESAELRKRLGKELKTYTQNNFSKKKMFEETFKLYS